MIQNQPGYDILNLEEEIKSTESNDSGTEPPQLDKNVERLKEAHLERIRRRNDVDPAHVSTNISENSNRAEVIQNQDEGQESSFYNQTFLNQLHSQRLSGDGDQENRSEKRKCELYMNLFAILLILIQGEQNCGIPMRGWLITYFLIQLFLLYVNILTERIDESVRLIGRRRLKKYIKVILIVSVEVLNCSWLVYGNLIYYSDDNNCVDYNGLVSYWMLALLIIGYFHLLLYLIVVIMIIVYYCWRFSERQTKKMESVSILKNLSRFKFNHFLFNAEEECIICWTAYNEQDELVKLKCNDKHYFHSKCIEDWIRSGNNTCPLCREPINKNSQNL